MIAHGRNRVCVVLLTAFMLVHGACKKDVTTPDGKKQSGGKVDKGVYTPPNVSPLVLSATAGKALPAVQGQIIVSTGLHGFSGSFDTTLPGTMGTFLTELLRFECHDSAVDVCSGFGVEASESNRADGSIMMTIMSNEGMLKEIYRDTITQKSEDYTRCGAASGVRKVPVIVPPTFVMGFADGSFKDLLTCVGSTTAGEKVSKWAYSMESLRPAYVSQSDNWLGQGYLRKNSETFEGEMMASMGVTASSHLGVMLLNAKNHRFILRLLYTPANEYVVAMGEGGVASSGSPNEGHFVLKVRKDVGESSPVTATYCVNNGTGQVETDGSLCSDSVVLGYFAGSSTWDELASWFGMESIDKSSLAGFMAAIKTGATIAPMMEIPTVNSLPTMFE